jgi:predicted transport protein
MREVFEQLRKRILNLDATVREEYKKMYIAYKTITNFVDIEPQVKRLSLSLNMKFSEINDPKELCKDLTGKGHYPNGDVGISVTSLDQIDDVMDLIRQSFEKHWEVGDV